MATTYILKLQSLTESIDILNGGNYDLVDGTFSVEPPKLRTDSESDVFEYSNREVVFDINVHGTSKSNVIDNLRALFKLLDKSHKLQTWNYTTATSGLGYSPSDHATGDRGVVLRVNAYDATVPTIDLEDGSTYSSTYELTFNIINGYVELPRTPLMTHGIVDNGNGTFTLHNVHISLECEPYALGPIRVISHGNNLSNVADQQAPWGTDNKVLYIPASSLPGDAQLPTRIASRLQNSTAIVISRYAGLSVINAASVPKNVNTGADATDFFVIGGFTGSPTHKFHRVKFTASNQFQYSTDDGATWSSVQTIYAHKEYWFAPNNEIGVMFLNDSGYQYTSNNVWKFAPNQIVIPVNSSGTIASGDASFFGKTGKVLGSFRFNVPSWARGRYIVFMNGRVNNIDTAWAMLVSSMQIQDVSGRLTLQTFSPVLTPWVVQPGNTLSVVLGSIDLTSVGAPYLDYPNGTAVINVSLYAKALSGTGAPTYSIDDVFLLSAQDDYATLIAGWSYDFQGREIYSSMDMRNPYIGEISAAPWDKNLWEGAPATPLYGTPAQVDLNHILSTDLPSARLGNPVTLVPGIDNYLLVLPSTLLGTDADWRGISGYRTAQLGEYYVAARPRYLFMGV